MSRIIVKGIPKHAKEPRIKQHFSSKGEVTACDILKTPDGVSRGIVFIGYRTAEQAQEAIKFFNRSFFDTSRIFVEEAKRKGDESIPRPWSKHSEGSSAHEKMLEKKKGKDGKKSKDGKDDDEEKAQKKKTGLKDWMSNVMEEGAETQEKKKDEKLEMFKSAVQRKTTKFWANDDLMEVENTNLKGAQPVPKKKKKSEEGEKGSSKEPTEKKKSVKKSKEDKMEIDDEVSEKKKVKKSVKKSASEEEPASKEEKEGKEKKKIKAKAATAEAEALAEVQKEEEVKEKIEIAEDDPEADLKFLRSRMTSSFDDDDEDNEEEDEEEEEEEDEEEGGSEAEDEEEAGDDGEAEAAEEDKEPEQENEAPPRRADEVINVEETARLYVVNVPYTATEQDLTEFFGKWGDISDVKIPTDPMTKKSTGRAFITYMIPSSAVQALLETNFTTFQGRILKVTGARAAKKVELAVSDKKAKSEFQKEKMESMKKKADTHQFSSLYVRADTVASAIAEKMGVDKRDILDKDAGNLAVRMALAETQIIREAKQKLEEAGVNLELLNDAEAKKIRSRTVILVKNLPAGTNEGSLRRLFTKYGNLDRVVIPPSGAIALVEFSEASEGKKAFLALAYRDFHGQPMYLEWAPQGVLAPKAQPSAISPFAHVLAPNLTPNLNPEPEPVPVSASKQAPAAPAHQIDSDVASSVASGLAAALAQLGPEPPKPVAKKFVSDSLFVKNMNFATKESALREMFFAVAPVKSVRLQTKQVDGRTVSAGYAFIQMESAEAAGLAMQQLNGKHLDGFPLNIAFSQGKATRNDDDQSQWAKSSKSSNANFTPVLATSQPAGFAAPSADFDAQRSNSGAQQGADKMLSKTKIIIRNVSFKATQQELTALASPFGEIKNVRLPMKIDGQHRGFCFVDYTTEQDAKAAFDALSQTHMYGRHLVVEYAQDDNSLEALREKTARRFDVLQRDGERKERSEKGGKRRRLNEEGDNDEMAHHAFDKERF